MGVKFESLRSLPGPQDHRNPVTYLDSLPAALSISHWRFDWSERRDRGGWLERWNVGSSSWEEGRWISSQEHGPPCSGNCAHGQAPCWPLAHCLCMQSCPPLPLSCPHSDSGSWCFAGINYRQHQSAQGLKQLFSCPSHLIPLLCSALDFCEAVTFPPPQMAQSASVWPQFPLALSSPRMIFASFCL